MSSDTVLSQNAVQGSAVFESLSTSVLVLDAELRLVTMNPAAESLLDASATRLAMHGTVLVQGEARVGPAAEWALGPTTVVNIDTVGTLRLEGDGVSKATISGDGGNGYALTVNGMVAARNYEFRDMGPAGIVIPQGATIAPTPDDLRGGG